MKFHQGKGSYAISVGFPGDASGKGLACQHRRHKRWGFHPWIGRSPGGGHGNQLQYSCLENPTDRGAWWAIVHRVAESQTWLKWLSMCKCHYHICFGIITESIHFIGYLIYFLNTPQKIWPVSNPLKVHSNMIFFKSFLWVHRNKNYPYTHSQPLFYTYSTSLP